jgi:small-conductance mechanosensitive channel
MCPGIGKHVRGNHMNQETSIPLIRFYIFLSFLLSALFLIVALLLMASLGSVRQGLLFIFLVWHLIFSLVAGIFGWLIDKGARGKNRLMALKAIGAVAGFFYGAVAGGTIAAELFGSTASIWGFISLSLLGLVVGSRVGPILGSRLAGFMGVRI